MKRCRYSRCKQAFEPKYRSTEVTCSVAHAIEYAKESAPERRERVEARMATAERVAVRERLKTLKSLAKVTAETQREVNRYIRERDFGLPCISCDRKTGAQMHAGHYRTTKAAPQLRFNHDNLWLQCEHCNTFLSGNIVEYRKRLIVRIGIERVEALENDNSVKRWDRDELISIRKKHAGMWRALKHERESAGGMAA